MENKNNNGVGIFYGVIGVATLVVAIIGATFAYFSATANSTDNAISTTASQISLGFTDDATGMKSNLIPVWASVGGNTNYSTLTGTASTTANATASAFPGVVGTGSTKCVDKNGNNICGVYTFTVSNSSSSAQQIYFSMGMTGSATGAVENLHYAVFKGAPSDVTSFDVDGTAVTSNPAKGDLVISDTAFPATVAQSYETSASGISKYAASTSANSVMSVLTQVLPATTGSVTYTIVFWVQDTGSAQTQGGSFTARIDVTTSGGGTGVTGVIGS